VGGGGGEERKRERKGKSDRETETETETDTHTESERERERERYVSLDHGTPCWATHNRACGLGEPFIRKLFHPLDEENRRTRARARDTESRQGVGKERQMRM